MSKENVLYPDPFETFRLATLVLSDFNPLGCADAAYLFGHTPDNEISILEGGVELYKRGNVKKLVLCGGGPYRAPNSPPDAKIAYSGADLWRVWLRGAGVEDSDIIDVPRPELSHTGTEAYLFAELAKDREWKAVYIVGWPAHMLRCFANMVNAINRVYPPLIVYCKSGTPLPWGEEALSSQGTLSGNRFGAIMEGEWKRLNTIYHNRYDVAGAEEVIDYLGRREQLTAKMI